MLMENNNKKFNETKIGAFLSSKAPKVLHILKLKTYNVAYDSPKPILMPFNGRWMTPETWEE